MSLLPVVRQCGRKGEASVGAQGVVWVCAIPEHLIGEKNVFIIKVKLKHKRTEDY